MFDGLLLEASKTKTGLRSKRIKDVLPDEPTNEGTVTVEKQSPVLGKTVFEKSVSNRLRSFLIFSEPFF